jgi:hypothetical protein
MTTTTNLLDLAAGWRHGAFFGTLVVLCAVEIDVGVPVLIARVAVAHAATPKLHTPGDYI